MIPELEALKWAASPAAAPPDVERVDEEALRFLLQHHGLMHRFVLRAMQERPRWCRGMFLATLRLAKRDVERGVQRQIAAMQEAARLCGPGDAPPIVFKGGMAVYGLTGDPRTMRPGGDIDLLAPDARACSDLLRGAGYREDTPHAEGDHEEATLHRRGVTIEVHRRFDVTVFDPALFETSPADGCPQGETPLPDPPPLKHLALCYADVAEGAMRGITAETRDIWFPDPAMLALILCGHIVNHTLYQPSEHDIYFEPRIFLRLAEVADICDLMQHPRFDQRRLLRLCEQWEASASVRFALSLARAYLRADPFPALNTDSAGGRIRIPLRVYQRGCVFMETTPDALLVDRECALSLRRMGASRLSSLYDRDLASVIAQQGPNVIAFGADAVVPERQMIRAVRRPPFPVRVSAIQAQGQDGVTLTVHFLEPLSHREFDYHLCALHQKYGQLYWASIRFLGQQLDQAGSGQGELTTHGEGYTLTILLPRTEAEQAQGFPILLHLMLWDKGQDDPPDLDPILAIPLLVA